MLTYKALLNCLLLVFILVLFHVCLLCFFELLTCFVEFRPCTWWDWTRSLTDICGDWNAGFACILVRIQLFGVSFNVRYSKQTLGDNVTRVLCPPDDLWPKLNEQETENLKNFQKEMAVIQIVFITSSVWFQVLSKIFTYIPQQLSTKQWLELAKLDQFSERFDMVRFSRHLERKKQNREIAKLERASASVVRVSNPDPHKEYNLFQFVLHGTMGRLTITFYFYPCLCFRKPRTTRGEHEDGSGVSVSWQAYRRRWLQIFGWPFKERTRLDFLSATALAFQ